MTETYKESLEKEKPLEKCVCISIECKKKKITNLKWDCTASFKSITIISLVYRRGDTVSFMTNEVNAVGAIRTRVQYMCL